MVQPNGVPEEIPGNDMVNNIIDQASAEIDRELATTAESQAQPLTADQVQQIVQSQMQPFQTQISGLQSLVDRGLNSIRRDSESALQQMQQQTLTQQNQERRNQYLNSLDTREREVAEPLLEEIENLKQSQINQLLAQQSVPQNEPVDNVQQNVQNQWEQVYKIVEDMGLNRNDPNVNYSILMDSSKTDPQKQQEFFASVRSAVVQQGQSSTQTPATQPDPQAQTPPMENSRQGNNGSHNNMDELLDWYLTIGSPNSEQQAYYNQKFEQFS